MAAGRPPVDHRIEVMNLHMCQRLGYDWILGHIGRNGGVQGKRVLDFGPNGYPLIGLLALMGAEGFWCDRGGDVPRKMAEVERRYGVKLQQVELGEARDMDIIIASNAIQHNRDVDGLYEALAGALARGGDFYVVEALTGYGAANWDDRRSDPHWLRCAREHKASWGRASLYPVDLVTFAYKWNDDRAKEHGAWTDGEEANRIMACLRKRR